MSDRIGELLEIARANGLALDPASARLDESGADFRAVHGVDGRGVAWIARFPRRADVAQRAQRERGALERVRGRIPVEVPRWEVFSPEVIAYPRLSGHPAAVVDVEAGGYVWRFDETHPPEPFLDSLAAALAALHSISAQEAAAAGLPVRTPAEVRQAHAARMERARGILRVPDSVWRRWQAWIGDDGCWPDFSVPIHGDLHPAHVLVDDDHHVTGLLDWTEMQVADPAADFAVQHATMGRTVIEELLARYAAAGGRVWPRMADHVAETWSAYPAVIAEFAEMTGEDGPRQLAQMLVDLDARALEGA